MLADILGSEPDTCEPMELIHRIARAHLADKALAEGAKMRAEAHKQMALRALQALAR